MFCFFIYNTGGVSLLVFVSPCGMLTAHAYDANNGCNNNIESFYIDLCFHLYSCLNARQMDYMTKRDVTALLKRWDASHLNDTALVYSPKLQSISRVMSQFFWSSDM